MLHMPDRHRIVRSSVLLAVGALAVLLAGPARAQVKDQPLMNLRESVQEISPKNFLLTFSADAFLPKEGGDSSPFEGTVARAAGEWLAGQGKAPKYNQATHVVEVVSGQVSESKMTAKLKITLKPDRWVPKDGKPREMTAEIDAKILPLTGTPEEGPTPIRFWHIKPKSQGAELKLEGTFTSQFEGRTAKGKVTGTFSLPVRKGSWNMGQWDDGLKLHFNMGTERVNWNHVRLTLAELASVRDLSGYKGLRMVVASPKPRTDVSVSVWLREEDGSWYYMKKAIPLADATNESVLLFDDFAEAEWVAPGNHMDEDYVFDTSAISHMAIGVVNPLGVGEVDFTVQKIDLLADDRPALEPAKVVATGKTLSVNGYEFVPPGLFGGYAPHLPQKFRPGCQRDLYPSTYPRVPAQRHTFIGDDDLTDAVKLAKALTDPQTPAAKRIVGMVSSKRMRGVQRIAKSGKAGRDARNMARGLNELLRKRGLYDADAFSNVKLPADLQAKVARIGDLNDTELMRVNRQLIGLAFEGLIAEMGPPATELFHLDCLGERKEPAWLLSRSNWREALAGFGRAYAANCQKADYEGYFEFWNEPYLNWAERSRVNYNLKFYNVGDAQEGGPVRVRYGGRTDGPVIPHLKWRKVDGKWQVYDPTAFSYWSGRGNGWIYDQMLAAVGKAIKDTNPKVRVLAGWGFRWNEDHWAAWDILYKPTIDRNINWIDGIHEHHYQGDTTAMPGSYEVVAAYGKTRYDKWLPCYNTETNDLIDVPARGFVDTPAKAAAAKNYRRMVYNLRDILYCVFQTPDKALGRTVIHWPHTEQGSEVCYTMLKNLRGRLIRCETSDPDVWMVASIDGTDPRAMPPGQPDRREYVAFVFNDHRSPRTIEVTVEAPEGTRFSTGVIEKTYRDEKTFQVALLSEKAAGDATRRTYKITLPERGAWKIALPLTGKVPDEVHLAQQQFFAKEILQDVLPTKTLTASVQVDKDMLARAGKAWLRLVVENLSDGEGSVEVAGRRIALPKARTADNINRIVLLPVDPKVLDASNSLVFRVNEGNFDGYRVDMASIVVEAPAK